MDKKPSFEDIVDDLNKLIRLLIEDMPNEGLDETVVYGFSIIKRGDECPIVRKVLPEEGFEEFDEMDSCARFEPHIETSEGDNEVYITAEVPDIQKENVEVNVRDGVAHIIALGQQRSCSLMSELPCAVDASLPKISYSNGVLEIILPKCTDPSDKA